MDLVPQIEVLVKTYILEKEWKKADIWDSCLI